MSVNDIIMGMTYDEKGIIFLGDDGVLRSIDGEHKTVLDACGLSPAQIKEYFEGAKPPESGWAIPMTDGRGVSKEDMFHPPEHWLPPRATPEQRAETLRYNEELRRQGVTTCELPKPSGSK